MPFIPVSKIRGVNQAECRGGKQLAFFALAGGGFDQFGRIPLAEIDLDSLRLKPSLEEVDLRGLARSIQTFDGDEASWKIQFRECFHVIVRHRRFAILLKASITDNSKIVRFVLLNLSDEEWCELQIEKEFV